MTAIFNAQYPAFWPHGVNLEFQICQAQHCILPLQTVYADFYIVDDLWPDFQEKHVSDALQWYQKQDVTLGG